MSSKSRKKEELEEDLPSTFVLTLFASSTALPGKAKPPASIWYEAFHKLTRNSWVTNIITGVASLIGGAKGGSVMAGGGDVIEATLQGTAAAVLVGILFFLVGYWITLLYVKVTPP